MARPNFKKKKNAGVRNNNNNKVVKSDMNDLERIVGKSGSDSRKKKNTHG